MSRMFKAVVVLGVLALFVGRVAYAQAGGAKQPQAAQAKAAPKMNHTAEAMTHTEAAIKVGQAGHADSVVVHAQEALTHAQAAQKMKANVHLEAAIKSLQEAIDHGKLGHADVATKAAQAALDHLKQAK